jgi:AcrR family transcriptional regulator
MGRSVKFTKDELVKKGVLFIKEKGLSQFSTRNVAKYIGCSTQPFFKNYLNMELYKGDLYIELFNDFEQFLTKNVRDNKDLVTLSYAYILYSKREANSFEALFFNNLDKYPNIKEKAGDYMNRMFVTTLINQYKFEKELAVKTSRDIVFYLHGIASIICYRNTVIKDAVIYNLLRANIPKYINYAIMFYN